jgi:hypothetical protein
MSAVHYSWILPRRSLKLVAVEDYGCGGALASRSAHPSVGKSTTAIYGMIKGDTTRFNAEALTDFLKRIGTTAEEWNRE